MNSYLTHNKKKPHGKQSRGSRFNKKKIKQTQINLKRQGQGGGGMGWGQGLTGN